jgi:predicted nuclease of predicted toxin-antitoxin system
MRFIVDECTGSNLAEFLKQKDHEVISVFDDLRGVTDDFILEKCFSENYILITSDKDFGEMVFRMSHKHKGIILIRCSPNNFQTRIEVLSKLLDNYKLNIENNFVVVTNTKVRIVT